MIASFYYIPTQNLEWNKFIYIYLVSLQKKKTRKPKSINSKPENEDKKENRNQSIKTKMKLLCHIVTDHIHNYHSARLDTEFKVG